MAKITVTETEETPLAPGVKLVRDVTADDPKPKEDKVVKETVTIEKKSSDD
jgi:hypothetical protein